MTIISSNISNSMRFVVQRIGGATPLACELVLDVSRWSGHAVETVEDHLGGEPFFAWVRRLADSFSQGIGMSELRARDIIAMVYLARVHAEPALAWTDVSRTIAPYTLEVVAQPAADVATAPANGELWVPASTAGGVG